MDHLFYLATVHPVLIIFLVVFVGLGLAVGLPALYNMISPDRDPSRTPDVLAREAEERARNISATRGLTRNEIDGRAHARRTGQQSEATSIH